MKCKAALDVAKKAILKYLDESKEEYIKAIKKDFAGKRSVQVATMEQLIGQSVISKIEIEKKKIEMLENKLKDAVEKRDSSVQKLNRQLERVNALLKRALDLKSDIDTIRVDVIKEQEI